jgi:hypothetical protein
MRISSVLRAARVALRNPTPHARTTVMPMVRDYPVARRPATRPR